MVIAHESAQSLATLDGPLTIEVPVPREEQDVALALMVALGRKWSTYSLSARRKERSPKRMTFDRPSSFTDRTQRSAQAFRFGLRAGSVSGSTWPEAMMAQSKA